MNTKNLTPKQEKFAQVYIETGNASEACQHQTKAVASNETTISQSEAADLLDVARNAIGVLNLVHHALMGFEPINMLRASQDFMKPINGPELRC